MGDHMRVAYTLNGKQPVTCTHIGDKPIFFIEDEFDKELESLIFFMQFELSLLEKEAKEYERRGHEIMRANIRIVK